MSSLWNRSGTIERYADDLRAVGAKAYFFQGGTTTPLTVYQDSGEAAAHPSPVVADANGRWPDIFVPYVVSYDVRVTSADDVQLTYSLEIPNPDPVEVSVTAAPEDLLQTGMIHAELVNGTKAGYVRLNGRTIGNGSSTGTERQNDDTEDLFIYLWNALTDAIAPVSSGRGGSAQSDFDANKTITLPNFQGAIPIGLDDMGATAGGFFTGLTFAVGNATLAGSSLGSNGITLVSANLPAHSHSGTTAAEGAHTHTGTTGNQSADHTHSGTTGDQSVDHTHTSPSVNDPGHVHDLRNDILIGNNGSSDSGPGGIAETGSEIGAAVTTVSATTGITLSATTGTQSVSHTHNITTGIQSTNHTHTFTTGAGSLHSHTFTTDSVGSSTPLNNLPRSVLVTWFIKL